MSFPAFNFDNIRKEPLGTVYLVDDDADVRDSLRRLLESQDYRVEAYDSGEAFIAKYDPNAIAVLLLDQRMPGMPGTEVQDHLIKQSTSSEVFLILILIGFRDSCLFAYCIRYERHIITQMLQWLPVLISLRAANAA